MSVQSVLGVVGGVVGSFFGYPQLGFVLGSLVGTALTPGAKTEGPRLSDLTVQGSAYGAMVPVVYGSFKLAGNVIFATDIREVAVKKKVGKGSSPTHTEYTYNVDIAIALCDNEISAIRKVYNDGKLIFDASSGASLESVVASEVRAASMRVYLGTETQLPDPTIQAALGAANTPAFLGTAYVVFSELDCPFGRIPQLSFEVLAAATEVPVLASGDVQTLPESPGGVTSGIQPLTYVSPNNQPTPIFTQVVNVSLVGYVFKVDMLGYAYLAPYVSGPQTGIRYQNSGVRGWMDTPMQAVVEYTQAGAVFTGYLKLFNVEGANTHSYPIVITNVTDGSVERVSKFGNYLLVQMERSDITGAAYALFDFAGGGLIASYLDTRLSLNCVLSSRYAWSVVDISSVRSVQVHSLADMSVLDTFSLSDEPGDPSVDMKIAPLENGNLGLLTLSSSDTLLKLWELDEDGNQRLVEQDVSAGTNADYVTALMEVNHAVSIVGTNIFGIRFVNITGTDYTVEPFVYRLRGVSEQGVGLDSIITDICARAGLDSSRIDVTELSDDVDGYGLTTLSSARANIDPLLTAFFVDPVPSDGKVKFRPRSGQSSVATITYDDLGAGEPGADPQDLFPLTRSQEYELPRSMAVNYINKNDDYQVGTEPARRIVTNSYNDQTVQLPIVMDSNRAASIAWALLYNAWSQRNMRTGKTTREFAQLDAGDVVTVEYPRGTFAPYRINRASDNGQVCSFDLQEYEGDVFTADVPGNQDTNPQVVTGTSPSQVRLLDIPILRDADDDAGMYAAVSSYTDSWSGAALFVGRDDVTMELRDSFSEASIAGTANTALGDWTSGMFDETNTVIVAITSGDLFNAMREQVLAGQANAALLGDEILQFKTATLISGNTYRLSGLLRGLRGTEANRSTHVVGERFVLLEADALGRVAYDLAELGEARFFKAVTIGQRFSDVSAVSATNTGIGLKPFSPVNLRKTINGSGNTVMTWDRRTRLSDNWLLGTVPLGEASEEYDVLVTDLVGAVLFEDTVTTAQWAHPSSPTNLTNAIVTVWQKSASVGRGFPVSLTI